MHRFVAALGACLVLGGGACAPVAQVSPPASFAYAWPDDQRGSAWFAEGGYRLSTRLPGEFVAVRAPLADVPRDVIVSGTLRKVGGPPGGGYGLILEDQGTGAGDGVDQSGQFVVAAVGDRGDFGIWRRDGVRWIDLVPWTPSSAVHTNTSANDLSVQLIAGRLTFLVNGDNVADLPNDAVGMGPRGVGVFTGGDLNEVLVNRFQVQVPGRSGDLIDLRPAPGQRATPQPMPQGRRPAVPPSEQRPPSNAPGDQPGLPDVHRVRDLLIGIADDVGAIAESFSGGLDNPRDPVNDPIVLQQDADRLAAATSKANELQAQMERIQNGAPGGR